jgi:hypothetical protein
MTMAMSAATLIEGQRCLICRQGTLRKAKAFMGLGSAYLRCDSCHIEYHQIGTRYSMRNIPKQNRSVRFENVPLSAEEIARIGNGGLSDSELAMQARQAEVASKKAESERQERLERGRTPGTAQYYLAQFRRIIGSVEGEDSTSISFKQGSRDEVKTSLAQIRQFQKELRQLKKEIAQTVRIKKQEVTQIAFTKVRAQTMRNLTSLPYGEVTKLIDSTLVQLDGLKLKLEIPSIEVASPSEDKPSPLPNLKASQSIMHPVLSTKMS